MTRTATYHSVPHRPNEQFVANAAQSDRGLDRTPTYLEEMAKHHDRNRALGAAAGFMVNNIGHHERYYGETYIYKIREQLSDFVAAQRVLDVVHERKEYGQIVAHAEYDTEVDTAIKFNHMLRELVNERSNLKPSEIARYVEYTALRSMHMDARYAVKRVGDALDGMRHEVAFEGLFAYIPDIGDGVDDEGVYPATAAEERKGIDLRVKYKGRIFRFDVKASEKKAKKTAVETTKWGNANAIPVWSGLYPEDFGDSLRIRNQDLIKEQAERVHGILEEAYAHGSCSAINMIAYS